MGGVQQSKLLDSNAMTGLSFLEEGQFAKIYKGYLSSSRQVVAIKVPKVPEFLRKEKKAMKVQLEEARKLLQTNFRKARSEHIVSYINVSYDDFRKEIWVVREYIDGTDLETVMKNPSLCPSLVSPEEKIRVATGIAKGLSYLHNLRNPIVHGDFKPSDILLTAKTKVPKISNFGLWDFKKFFIEQCLPPEVVFLNPHQAPEVLLGEERPTLCSDSWSLGCILLQWMLERPPWDLQDLCTRYQYRLNKQEKALRDAMENKEFPTVVMDIDSKLEFLKDCFLYEATARPKTRMIEEELSRASRTPTWTNIAYHKYYQNQPGKTV